MNTDYGMSEDLAQMYLQDDENEVDDVTIIEPDNTGDDAIIEPEKDTDPDNTPDEDPDLGSEPDEEEPDGEDTEPDTAEPDTIDPIIAKLLKSKNLDPYKLKIDVDGVEEERSFDELSEEAQMNILNYDPNKTLDNLDDIEVNTINFLRTNKVTLEELIDYHRNEAIQQYLDYQQEGNLDIGTMDADELYFNHLASEFPELSEDQLNRIITKEKEELDIYNIKVDKLRSLYQEKQQTLLTDRQEQLRAQEESNYNEAVNSLNSVLAPMTSLNSTQLEEDDKQEILSYLLKKGADGRTSFVKDLDDPDKLIKAAWYLNYGEEAHRLLVNYFTDAVKKAGEEGYKKGKAEVKGKLNGSKPKPKSTIVTKKTLSDPALEGLPEWQKQFLNQD